MEIINKIRDFLASVVLCLPTKYSIDQQKNSKKNVANKRKFVSRRDLEKALGGTYVNYNEYPELAPDYVNPFSQSPKTKIKKRIISMELCSETEFEKAKKRKKEIREINNEYRLKEIKKNRLPFEDGYFDVDDYFKVKPNNSPAGFSR